MAVRDDYDVVVVGAGFAGLYMLHRLRGLGLAAHDFDSAGGVGGTWYWNRYPGARCDVESMEYSYSFSAELQQEWEWSERFPAQPEILRYLNHVVDRFDLRPHIELQTRVLAIRLDEREMEWTVETSTRTVRCRFVVMASGCLSVPRLPDIPGIECFAGESFHTANWPHHDVDFAGLRVGVVGTGSSGIQVAPVIAGDAAHLTVFQRTPHFSLPARNGPLDPETQAAVKRNYEQLRSRERASHHGLAQEVGQLSALDVDSSTRRRLLDDRWRRGGAELMVTFRDIMRDANANGVVAEYVRQRIREIVRDPDAASALLPGGYPIGAKRICLDSQYYETFNRPNVTLVDVRRSPIEAIVADGIKSADRVYELDVIVFATGFDAMTGALSAIDIRGRNGVKLVDLWASGPVAYLGLAVHGLPNLFLITGPGSPSVLSNMVLSIEQHVDWIADCIDRLEAEGSTIEAELDAQIAWVDHVRDVAAQTLYTHADSWYLGANVPGRPRVFMPYVGGVHRYGMRCRQIVAAGYEGFHIEPARQRSVPS